MFSREKPFWKLCFQGDQENLLESLGGHFFNTYFFEGHNKSAASDLFTKSDIANYAPPKGKFLVHSIGMGCDEDYGPNRNVDGWPLKGLLRKVATFVTHGHSYREHRNKEVRQAIGQIKAAGVHPKLRRVETLQWLDCEKAPKEYEMAKQAKELHFSMSARVPSDRCTCCGNLAKRAEEYCKHIKETPLQFLDSFQKYAYVQNDEPTFYDMSVVEYPADRTAHHISYAFHNDEMQKAASSGRVITGAEWADIAGLNNRPAPVSASKMRLLTKMAGCENQIAEGLRNGFSKTDFIGKWAKYAMPYSFGDRLFSEAGFKKSAAASAIRALMPGTFFRELSKRACVLPLEEFAVYAFPDELYTEEHIKSACCALPSIFRKLLSAFTDEPSAEMADEFDSDSSMAAASDPANTDEVQQLMDKATEKFSQQEEPIKKRISITIIRISPKEVEDKSEKLAKEASISPDNKLAEIYALYKLAAVNDILENSTGRVNEDMLCFQAVGQNFFTNLV